MYGARLEYALHSLVNLAMQGNAPASARALAEFQELPVAFVRKLMSEMGAAGLIDATEGSGGGWSLARRTDQITVLDVADAVQADARLFECREVRGSCALWTGASPPRAASAGTCSIHRVMLDAQADARAVMARSTLADLVGAVCEKSSDAHLTRVTDWFTEHRSQIRADRRNTAGRDAAEDNNRGGHHAQAR